MILQPISPLLKWAYDPCGVISSPSSNTARESASSQIVLQNSGMGRLRTTLESEWADLWINVAHRGVILNRHPQNSFATISVNEQTSSMTTRSSHEVSGLMLLAAKEHLFSGGEEQGCSTN